MRPRTLLNLVLTGAIAGCAAAAAAPPMDVPPARPTGITLTPVIVDAGGRMTPAPAAPSASAAAVPAETVLAEAEGEATYYASKFDGRRAASGIVFRNAEPYAAHRTYPFGTVVRVTNLANERSVIVRVIDRGPHGTSARAQRTIIDVSQSAARDLDFIRAGRVPVRVEVLDWGDGRI
jgi:rare lipoprotein A